MCADHITNIINLLAIAETMLKRQKPAFQFSVSRHQWVCSVHFVRYPQKHKYKQYICHQKDMLTKR